MVKTYRTEIRETVVGEVEYHLIKSAGSITASEDDEIEVSYYSNCGDITNGISIGGVVFNKEDILEIAKRIRKR